MKPAKIILHCALLGLIPACGQVHADWAQAVTPLEIKTVPENNLIQPQNPPTFSWSRNPKNPAAYVLELKLNGTVVRTFTSSRSWYLPSKALPLGEYTWRVRPSTTTEWSSERKFVINAASVVYEVPENADLRARALMKTRPRGLQTGLPLVKNWDTTLSAQRGAAVTQLTKEVVWNITALPLISDANWPLDTTTVITAAAAAQVADIRKQLNMRTRQLESTVLLYRLTGEERFLVEALKRGDELAGFNPIGPTNYSKQDQAPFAIASSLIRAFDTLGSNLDDTRRVKWLRSVTAYGNQIYADLSQDNGRNDQYPYDSHAISNTAGLALISILALGDIPAANAWFDFSFRSYVSSLSVWSGPEGGFANGTAYGEFAVDLYMQVWQPTAQAMNVNLYAKPWSQGFLNFFMYFVPPGAQTHVFGDGHEVAPTAKIMRAYASNFATPEAAWYVKNMPAADDALTLLKAYYPLPATTVAPQAPTVSAVMLPSIGWSAMHSSMADPARTSVYFKSSPYGSYNHSHGDQNSFVITSAGVPLLAEGGWYDYYGSPLWSSWYRQTKAHNGLTFDGGIGQTIDGGNVAMITNNGKITAFATTRGLDYVEGDATAAYGGKLTSAIRKLWYVRDTDSVVVYDKAKSATARTWEWNMHAMAPIVTAADGSVSITNKGRTACIRPLITNGVRFEKRTGVPLMPGRVEDQAVFVSTAKSTSGEFLVLIDVGCKNPAVSLTSGATGRTLKVGPQTMIVPN
ncbi:MULTISPECIES: heparinase II/III family protein [unclassified Janthinobacterium]|uniref:heparinase II/III domain-containing protein n=1 Tax=unclassified Janthinobacterium TaxID=2610881 RepID=UPI001C5B68E8|nr:MULTISPECIES: heparinase II/III family protein [unclassified Janthinobacterium]MBW3500416.1 heparinase II/III family protein [Janthinobacterium sp. NKUCC08_JDC]MDX8123693.1 heparinase II/III family protein [Janthinobacterium sp. GMG2]